MNFSFSRLLTIVFISLTIIACSESTDANLKGSEIAKTIESAADVVEEKMTEVPKTLQTLPHPDEKLDPSVSQQTATTPTESEREAQTEPQVSVASQATETTATETAQVSNNFVAGTHYDIIEPSIEVSGDKVQVAELFWYGCGHCFRLEPYMVQWKKTKADYVDFVEVPAIFGPQWKFHAQAFYTTKALGIKETSHQKIFDSIHIDRKRISNLSQLQDLLKTLGQSPEKTEAAYKSFAVDANMRSAQLFGQKSGARAVPTIIVDGKYRTSVSDAGGHDQLIQLINHLAEKSNDERKG